MSRQSKKNKHIKADEAAALETKVPAAVLQFSMFARGDKVIVALSGGADSAALFHFLLAKRREWGITVMAAHLNHGLRGEAAEHDAAFSRQLCEKAGVPFFLKEARMADTPRPKRLSEEEWGRGLRYAFLQQLAEEHGAKIATAHTLSDNAETVLFFALRGTGPRGLGGIPPVRGRFIRPLLFVTRAEVEAYCAAHGLAFCDDETNASLRYSRNRLRHEVLPTLENVHPGALQALGRLALDMREVDTYLAAEAEVLLQGAKTAGGYIAADLLRAPQPVRLQALAKLAGEAFPDRAALDKMQETLAGTRGAWQLAGGWLAQTENGVFSVRRRAPLVLPPAQVVPLAAGRVQMQGGYTIDVSMREKGQYDDALADKKGSIFYADYSKIEAGSIFRTRRPRDSFSFAQRNVTKSVAKWMNEEKLPQDQRGCLPLLASQSRVLWLWGLGFCRGLAVDENTTRVLVLNTTKQEEMCQDE